MLGQTKRRGQTKRQQGGKPGYTITGAKIPAAPKRSITGAIIQPVQTQKLYPVSPMPVQNQSMQLGQEVYRSRGRNQRRVVSLKL